MTTADVSQSLTASQSGRLLLPSYERPATGVHPPPAVRPPPGAGRAPAAGLRGVPVDGAAPPETAAGHAPAPADRGDRAAARRRADHPDRFRPDHPVRRRAAGAADNRDRAGARLGRAAGAGHAGRDLADERGTALPPLEGAPPRPA